MTVLALALAALVSAALPSPPPAQEPAPERGGQLAEPDFDAYFPDDGAGGEALDAAYATRRGGRDLSDDAYIELVRRGLRRTTTRKLFILREFGNRFIWGKDPQRADAIELMFHAADPSPGADRHGTRHAAVYFGLSVTGEKTPRILDALVAIAMAEESADTIGRIAWGARAEEDELIARLAPRLASDDPAVREKAEDLVRIFRGEESARQWSRRRAIARARAEYAGELPGIRAAMRGGTSEERRAALDRMWETSLVMILEKEALADFERAATDPDPGVRRDVVRILGGEWIWSAAEQHGPTIDLMLEMSRDEDEQVRYDAVYYGLSTVRESRRDVVLRMLEMLEEPAISDLTGRLHWGLRSHGEMVGRILLGILENPEATRDEKVAAHGLHMAVLGEAPAVRVEGMMAPADLVGRWKLELVGPGGRTGTADMEITAKGDGFEVTSPLQPELGPVRLLVAQRGAAVAAGAGYGGRNEGLVMTFTLEDGLIEGVVMHAHERMLLPFTGVRAR